MIAHWRVLRKMHKEGFLRRDICHCHSWKTTSWDVTFRFFWFCFKWISLLDKLNTYFQLKCRGSVENYSEMKISRIFCNLIMTRAKWMGGRQTLVNDILPTIPWLPFHWHFTLYTWSLWFAIWSCSLIYYYSTGV